MDEEQKANINKNRTCVVFYFITMVASVAIALTGAYNVGFYFGAGDNSLFGLASWVLVLVIGTYASFYHVGKFFDAREMHIMYQELVRNEV